jgi:hypothetical protein
VGGVVSVVSCEQIFTFDASKAHLLYRGKLGQHIINLHCRGRRFRSKIHGLQPAATQAHIEGNLLVTIHCHLVPALHDLIDHLDGAEWIVKPLQ